MFVYKNLKVWQEALNLAISVYQVTSEFPSDERFGLTSQLRRASVSIPSNIAEGCGYDTHPQTNRFMQIAQGSAFEVETQLLIAKSVGLMPENFDFAPVLDKVNHVQRLIFNFKQYLENSK